MITVKTPERAINVPTAPELQGADTTIFSNPQSMTSQEREAVKKGEARGKRGYEVEHPHCGTLQTNNAYRNGWDNIFGDKKEKSDGESKGQSSKD